jgi:hypothetical protein
MNIAHTPIGWFVSAVSAGTQQDQRWRRHFDIVGMQRARLGQLHFWARDDNTQRRFNPIDFNKRHFCASDDNTPHVARDFNKPHFGASDDSINDDQQWQWEGTWKSGVLWSAWSPWSPRS